MSMTTLDTPRLFLRPFTPDDADAKYEIDRQAAVHRYQGFVREANGSTRGRTPQETRRALLRRIGAFELEGFGQWAAVSKESDWLIGWAGLQFYLLDHGPYSTPEIELFYGLSQEYWGRGFITEAGTELLRHGFQTLKVHRITSVAYRDNTRSLNVMRRLGMRIDDHPSDPDSMLGVIDNPAIAP